MQTFSEIIYFANIKNKVSFKNKKYAIPNIQGCIGQKKCNTKQIIICDIMLPLFSKYKKVSFKKKF